ncbi:hypothetical protein FHS10_002280 [Mucilaginibacter dorajii]|nr:hypothetical protein [Mucilaginibacter dorajii]
MKKILLSQRIAVSFGIVVSENANGEGARPALNE